LLSLAINVKPYQNVKVATSSCPSCSHTPRPPVAPQPYQDIKMTSARSSFFYCINPMPSTIRRGRPTAPQPPHHFFVPLERGEVHQVSVIQVARISSISFSWVRCSTHHLVRCIRSEKHPLEPTHTEARHSLVQRFVREVGTKMNPLLRVHHPQRLEESSAGHRKSKVVVGAQVLHNHKPRTPRKHIQRMFGFLLLLFSLLPCHFHLHVLV